MTDLGAFAGASDTAAIEGAFAYIQTQYASLLPRIDNGPMLIAFVRQGAWSFYGTLYFRNNIIDMTVTQNYNGKIYVASNRTGSVEVKTLTPT